MTTRRPWMRMAFAAAIVAVTMAATGIVGASPRHWRGAETFAPVAVGPNVERCGPFPANLEARFAGSGIDNFGGPFAVVVSGCLDTEALVLSDLEATDTYLRTGDSLSIEPADAVLDFDPSTCTATNVRPVRFDVAGGTGGLVGAGGRGVYELAFTLPACPGPQQVVHLWFQGTIGVDPT